MFDELMEFWEHRHADGTCEQATRQGEGLCPFCEAARKGVSVYDVFEE